MQQLKAPYLQARMSARARGAARTLGLALLVMLAAPMGLVHAQTAKASANSVKAVLTQSVVTTADGKETLSEAKEVKPGDLLEFRVVYSNQTGRAVNNFVATLPLARGFEYVPHSTMPAGATTVFSTGDGKYAAEPLMQAGADPAKPAKPVALADYRSVRWTFGKLAADASVEVVARVRVEGLAQPTVIAPEIQALRVPPANPEGPKKP